MEQLWDRISKTKATTNASKASSFLPVDILKTTSSTKQICSSADVTSSTCMVTPAKRAKLSKEQLSKLSLQSNGSTFKLLASKIQQRMAIQRNAFQYSIFKPNVKQPILNAYCNTNPGHCPVEYQCYMNNMNIPLPQKITATVSSEKERDVPYCKPCFPFPQYYYVYISGRLKNRTSSFSNHHQVMTKQGDGKQRIPGRNIKQAIYKLGSISKRHPGSRSHVHLTDDAYDEEFEEKMQQMDEILRGHPPRKKTKIQLARSTESMLISLFGPDLNALSSQRSENYEGSKTQNVNSPSIKNSIEMENLVEPKNLSSFFRKFSDSDHSALYDEQVKKIHAEYPQIARLEESLNFLPQDEDLVLKAIGSSTKSKKRYDVNYGKYTPTTISSCVGDNLSELCYGAESQDGENSRFSHKIQEKVSKTMNNNGTPRENNVHTFFHKASSRSRNRMPEPVQSNQSNNQDECFVEISLHRPPYKTNKAFEARTKAIREKQIRLEMEKHTRSASFARLKARRMKLMSFVSFQDTFRPLGKEYSDDAEDTTENLEADLSSLPKDEKETAKTGEESAVQVFPASGVPRTVSSRSSTKRSISCKMLDAEIFDPTCENSENLFEAIKAPRGSSVSQQIEEMTESHSALPARGNLRQFLSDQMLNSSAKKLHVQTLSGTVFGKSERQNIPDVTDNSYYAELESDKESLPSAENTPCNSRPMLSTISECAEESFKSTRKNSKKDVVQDVDAESMISNGTVTLDDFNDEQTEKKMSRSSFLSRLSRSKMSKNSANDPKRLELAKKSSSKNLPSMNNNDIVVDYLSEIEKALSELEIPDEEKKISLGNNHESICRTAEQVASQVNNNEALVNSEVPHSQVFKTSYDEEQATGVEIENEDNIDEIHIAPSSPFSLESESERSLRNLGTLFPSLKPSKVSLVQSKSRIESSQLPDEVKHSNSDKIDTSASHKESGDTNLSYSSDDNACVVNKESQHSEVRSDFKEKNLQPESHAKVGKRETRSKISLNYSQHSMKSEAHLKESKNKNKPLEMPTRESNNVKKIDSQVLQIVRSELFVKPEDEVNQCSSNDTLESEEIVTYEKSVQFDLPSTPKVSTELKLEGSKKLVRNSQASFEATTDLNTHVATEDEENPVQALKSCLKTNVVDCDSVMKSQFRPHKVSFCTKIFKIFHKNKQKHHEDSKAVRELLAKKKMTSSVREEGKNLQAKDSVQLLREKRLKFFEEHQEFYEDSIRAYGFDPTMGRLKSQNQSVHPSTFKLLENDTRGSKLLSYTISESILHVRNGQSRASSITKLKADEK